MTQLMIYGAKSLALGACKAIQQLYPEYEVTGFIVSQLAGNPRTLNGLPVRELSTIQDRDINILIATPEDCQEEIASNLSEKGFSRYECMDSKLEEKLMSDYYDSIHRFPSIGDRCIYGYMARFHKDRPLKQKIQIPDWIEDIQVGAVLTEQNIAKCRDDLGENISGKNPNYCELTALYWIWKNKLSSERNKCAYYGLFQYRRLLHLTERDIQKVIAEKADVVLPYPLIHEPSMLEHHTRYVSESDWEAMLQAIKEKAPSYAERMDEILDQPYMYNYNIIFARAEVLNNYCEWLFPILERVEELSSPKGWERTDRYIGYLGENLMTIYFMYHQKDLRIYHTGRMMLT